MVFMIIMGLKQFATLLILCGIVACSVIDEYAMGSPTLEDDSEYFIVFGDIQGYTVSSLTMAPYDKSINWILNQLDDGVKLKCILQDGDVSETNSEEEWERFRSSSIEVASRIPFFSSVGNHDYDRTPERHILGRNTTKINDYARFSLTCESIVAYYEPESLENYIARVSINDKDVYILVLEFGVREEVLEWAKEYVSDHPNYLFLLMTHEWLTRDLKRMSSESYAIWQIGRVSSFSTPEQVWKSLVWPNDNIVCVLCGHTGFAGTLFSENQNGRKVPQILFNLQHLEKGGNGIIQIWRFDSQSDSVRICAFDTINKKWYMPDSTAVSFPFFIHLNE